MTRSVLGALDDTALHVMTLNVRRPLGRLAWRRADRWSRRRPLLAAMLADERPALVGCQEVVPSQARVIADALGPEYRRIGSGRTASPTSEGCAIFFDSGRLEVQEWHQSALSDSPDERGSRSWGNPFPRVLVTAVFRDRRTGARFAMLNTHLDPLSPRSRVRSALRIRETVGATGLPAIVTGDANEAIDPWTATLQGDTAYQVRAVVPELGHLIQALRAPVLTQVLLYGAPALLAGWLLLGIWRPATDTRDEEDQA